jgi:hypothetical protein
MKNWKTTTLGVLSILTALVGAAMTWLKGTQVDVSSLFAAIMAGVGLIHAKDASPTDPAPTK